MTKIYKYKLIKKNFICIIRFMVVRDYSYIFKTLRAQSKILSSCLNTNRGTFLDRKFLCILPSGFLFPFRFVFVFYHF